MEVVVGFTLLLLAVVAALSLLGSGLDLGKSGEQRVLAGNLAESILERERAKDFASLTPGSINLTDTADFATNVQVRRVIQEVEPTPPTRTLRVEVSWDTKRGRASLFREAYLLQTNR